MSKNKINYAIIPFSIVFTLVIIAYFGNQWFASTFGNPGVDYSYVFYQFNNFVPFVDWTIYPYILAYPFWIFSFFYVAYHSKSALYNATAMLIVSLIICGLWYFFFQSDVESWRLTSGLFQNDNYLTPRTDLDFTQKLVLLIYRSAGPRNAIPSMHTLMSWLSIISLRMIKKTPLLPKVFIWVLGISIIIATQTLKQHYIIDVIIGLGLAEGTFWLFKDSRFSLWLSSYFSKINQKYDLDREI